MLFATHSLHFRVHTRVLLTLLVACAVTMALWAEPPVHPLLREAAAAQKAGQFELALAKLEAARALRPDYPRLLLELARVNAAARHPDAACAALDQLARLGVAFAPAKDPALAALASAPAWAPLAARFAANAVPQGRADLALTLPTQDGIIETALADSHGRWFFADVRHRCIWTREADGSLRKFSHDRDGLLGVFSLALDESHARLWAGVAATPEMQGYAEADRGRAFLAEYDLTAGALVRTVALPADQRPHVLGSLTLAADGGLFATDSAAPVIWHVAPGATQAEAWLENDQFASLQGLAFSADGRALYVADYANGVWRIDVASKTPRLLRAPADTTLFGLDDLRGAGRALVAVQNGIAPARVLRIDLDAAGDARAVTVLAAALPRFTDLSGGWLRAGRYEVVGDAGWNLFSTPTAAPAPRDVPILSVPL
ncbi:hypothetical protein [Oleiharenicola sp. Vm1]|uniref:SMP-30/gluconolactonase/LRE family protein n=1 Tax=Oleiharenicola sp. Vm1 TaxID=3398393 RepID=UPI0039F59E71